MGRQWFEEYLEAWNSHDPRAVSAWMTENCIYEDLALGQVFEGKDGVESLVQDANTFSSDYRFEAVSATAAGDGYAVEWTMSGTNDGEAAGLPATGKPYTIRGVSVGRMENGKITANRDYWNMADYLSQVGIMPPPSGA